MNIYTDSPIYQKAFEQYLRKGTPIEMSLKMMAARTETRDNHSTALYRWRTSGDDKVRPSHAANEGRIFNWDVAPATGHPGEEAGCRCRAEPYVQEFLPNNSDINDPPLEDVYPELIFIPLFRFGKILANIFRGVRNVNSSTLTPGQARNLERFDKKLPKDAKEITVEHAANGQRIFRSDVPAKNIPGSFARYEKVVDRAGNTVSYTKTTYGPNGEIVHTKVKFGG